MSRTIRIVKMSGAGNDFVVLGPEEAAKVGGDLAAWSREVCRRGLSVGADGVMVVGPAGPDRVRMTFLNPDGSPAFCGNGSRCAARFAHLRGMAGESMVLETVVGEVPAEVDGKVVRVTLPPPRDRGAVTLSVGADSLDGRWIDAGVPHFVVFVPAVGEAPLETWGPAARRHLAFGPEGVNLDLVSRNPAGVLNVRTWERGVEGETLACGTGAVASALAAVLEGDSGPLSVLPRSGIRLLVDLPGGAARPEAAVLEGDARWVFEGTLGDDR